jgi:phage head maturation protease
MSFGFAVPDGGERWTGNIRELRQIDLKEISVIHSWPAYTGTTVNARAMLPTPKRLHLARLWLETCR